MRLLVVRRDEIEADFQRYYNMYLGDLFTGHLSLRRFSVLLYGLPPGAVTWRAQGGHLAQSDETRAALLVRHAIQTFQEGFAKNPERIPLPELPEWGHLEKEQANRDATSRRLARFLERQERNKARQKSQLILARG